MQHNQASARFGPADQKRFDRRIEAVMDVHHHGSAFQPVHVRLEGGLVLDVRFVATLLQQASQRLHRSGRVLHNVHGLRCRQKTDRGGRKDRSCNRPMHPSDHRPVPSDLRTETVPGRVNLQTGYAAADAGCRSRGLRSSNG